jgi:FtsH-binding integral membrane protein
MAQQDRARQKTYRFLARTMYRYSPITILLTIVAAAASNDAALTLGLLVVTAIQLLCGAWFSAQAKRFDE